MANIGAYSRHKMLDELNSPLYTNNGDGAVPLVYSPDEQRAKVLENLTAQDALQSTIVATTVATTAATQFKSSPTHGLIKMALTNFAMGTLTDNTNTGFGASLITFPTDTLVMHKITQGVVTGTGADNRTTLIEVGLGTTVAAGAISVLSGTAAMENILGGTNTSAFTDGGATSIATLIAPGVTTVNAQSRDYVALRTTTPGLVVFLNAAGAAQDVTANMTMTFTGVIVLEYVLGV